MYIYESFQYANELTDYLNEHKIKKENIVSINILYDCFYLIYKI